MKNLIPFSRDSLPPVLKNGNVAAEFHFGTEGWISLRYHWNAIWPLKRQAAQQTRVTAESVGRAKELGELAAFNLHPLCGGMPIDKAWESVQLYVDKVLPNV